VSGWTPRVNEMGRVTWAAAGQPKKAPANFSDKTWAIFVEERSRLITIAGLG
jgi:hypothetical protein